jgi:hypothetical protein
MTQPQEPQPTPTPTPEITYPHGPPDSLQSFPEVAPDPDGPFQVPQYPPYIPESQFDASHGMPRSTLDGIHGTTGDDPVRWSPSHPGELPPYWTKDYVQDTGDPNLWWPDKRPSPPGETHPAAFHSGQDDQKKPDQTGEGAGKLDVTPADLNNVADQYAELQTAAAAAIGPQAVDEVNRIIATHGAMGFPVAVGVVAGLARRQAQVEGKAAEFGRYAERFNEHAATYFDQDQAGARGYRGVQFASARSQTDSWDWDGETEEYEPINPGTAGAGPNAGPAIPQA